MSGRAEFNCLFCFDRRGMYATRTKKGGTTLYCRACQTRVFLGPDPRAGSGVVFFSDWLGRTDTEELRERVEGSFDVTLTAAGLPR